MNAAKFTQRLIGGAAALTAATLIFSVGVAPAQAATATYTTSYKFKNAVIDGNGKHTISPDPAVSTVGNGGGLKVKATLVASYRQGHKAPARVSLQRKIGGGGWKTVKKNLPVSGSTVEVLTPAYSTSDKSKVVFYRFKSYKYDYITVSSGYGYGGAAAQPLRASSTATSLKSSAKLENSSEIRQVTRNTYSKSVQITYENQQRYTGKAKQVYNWVKAYCPTTAVHVRRIYHDDTEGIGYYGIGGALLIEISPEIWDSKTYGASTPHGTSLHECTHERQFVNWGLTKGGYNLMTNTMPKYFKDDVAPQGQNDHRRFLANEHAADCAAFSVLPSFNYVEDSYGGYCNPAEVKAGNQIITGHKLR